MDKAISIIFGHPLILGSEPYITFAILENRSDNITFQTFFYGKMSERITVIHANTPAPCAKPEISPTVLKYIDNSGAIHPLRYVKIPQICSAIIFLSWRQGPD